MRDCPHCHNPIYDDDALLCHFCGNSLGRTSHGAMGVMRRRWLLVAVGMLVVGSFLALMIF